MTIATPMASAANPIHASLAANARATAASAARAMTSIARSTTTERGDAAERQRFSPRDDEGAGDLAEPCRAGRRSRSSRSASRRPRRGRRAIAAGPRAGSATPSACARIHACAARTSSAGASHRSSARWRWAADLAEVRRRGEQRRRGNADPDARRAALVPRAPSSIRRVGRALATRSVCFPMSRHASGSRR